MKRIKGLKVTKETLTLPEATALIREETWALVSLLSLADTFTTYTDTLFCCNNNY